MENIDKYLISQIISGRVVPFIGAGFSRPFGYPGWVDLLKKVMQKIGIEDLNSEDINKADPLQLAQSFLDYYKEKNHDSVEDSLIQEIGIAEDQSSIRDKLNQYLSSSIKKEIDQRLERKFSKIVLDQIKKDTSSINQTEINKLKLLGDLHFKQILTTNYDNVLEKEIFSNKGFKVLSLGNGDELNWDDSSNTIYKIHGDVTNENEIIFTHAQYYKFMHQFGYFRSKLYTLLSSNIILMMGYGFNDINIHQIYFQFIRDYDNDSSLGEKKFYMVLTQREKEKWKSYFPYYKRYLASYKINVIEVSTLPDFIAALSEKVRTAEASSDLSYLFKQEEENELFTTTLLDVIENNKDIKLSDDRTLNVNILKALHKIYKGPYILNKRPFNKSIEGNILESKIASNMFDYTNKLVNSYGYLSDTQEFIEIVNDSLDFVNSTGDFYEINNRIIDFITLSSKLKQKNYSREDDLIVGENMNRMFTRCHPTEYLRSNPGGRTLKSRLHEISTYHIKCFLDYLESELEDEYLLSRLQKYWLDELIKVNQEEIKTNINELIEKNQTLLSEMRESRAKDKF
ncbi:SIR2 family protein [Bacillus atrophaeus]|uniref:SIR2 family protein n=1 Tax=Bacillus atrophaeus TaxID=1452 RepID=UPI0031BA1E6E